MLFSQTFLNKVHVFTDEAHNKFQFRSAEEALDWDFGYQKNIVPAGWNGYDIRTTETARLCTLGLTYISESSNYLYDLVFGPVKLDYYCGTHNGATLSNA